MTTSMPLERFETCWCWHKQIHKANITISKRLTYSSDIILEPYKWMTAQLDMAKYHHNSCKNLLWVHAIFCLSSDHICHLGERALYEAQSCRNGNLLETNEQESNKKPAKKKPRKAASKKAKNRVQDDKESFDAERQNQAKQTPSRSRPHAHVEEI